MKKYNIDSCRRFLLRNRKALTTAQLALAGVHETISYDTVCKEDYISTTEDQDESPFDQEEFQNTFFCDLEQELETARNAVQEALDTINKNIGELIYD